MRNPHLSMMTGLLGVGLAGGASADPTVTSTADVDQLLNALLGDGVELRGNAAYVGAADAVGLFGDALPAGIGMEEGVVLSTGRVESIFTATQQTMTSTDFQTPGDEVLECRYQRSNRDAASLEFDFAVDDDTLYFNWLYASEEYNEVLDEPVLDVFAFFIDDVPQPIGPDGEAFFGSKLINCGSPPMPDGGDYCELFVNNDPENGGPLFELEYDGFTTVLTAEITGLVAGTQYRGRFVVADRSELEKDSAVLIEAATLSTRPTPVSLN